jgi:hypothetical protein
MTAAILTRDKPARTLTVDGHRIALFSVEPQVAAPMVRDSDGRERSRYRVEVDGIVRGHIVYIQSWYGSWEALNLGPLTRQGRHPERLNAIVSADGSPYQKPTRDSLARAFPGWIAAGRAPSHEELAAHRASDASAKQRESEVARNERQAEEGRWATLRAELAAKEQAKAAEIRDRLASLEALQARGEPILTNAEIEALAWAIERLRTTR